jgi:hypothetical protein
MAWRLAASKTRSTPMTPRSPKDPPNAWEPPTIRGAHRAEPTRPAAMGEPFPPLLHPAIDYQVLAHRSGRDLQVEESVDDARVGLEVG